MHGFLVPCAGGDDDGDSCCTVRLLLLRGLKVGMWGMQPWGMHVGDTFLVPCADVEALCMTGG